MKLSELLAMHPNLDAEVGDDMEERVVLDGLYLFRAIGVNDPLDQAYFYMESSPHTDGCVKLGLIQTAVQQTQAAWPVHVCDGDHD
jgi:hypothetical protein